MSKQIYIYTPESHFLKFISHPFERAGIYIYYHTFGCKLSVLNIATTRIRRLYNISRFMTISRMMTNIFSFVYMYYACVYAVYSIILYIIIYIHIICISLSNGDVSIYSRVF